MYKIIGADGKEYGPATGEQLRQWIVAGRANAQTKVRTDDSNEWKPLSAYPEFFQVPVPGPEQASPPALISVVGRHPTRTNGMAIAGFVMGLIAFLVGWVCCGPLFATLGIVFCSVGISQINKNPTEQTGKGLAIAGLVLSILGVVLYIIIVIFFGVLGVIGEALSK